MTVTFKLREMKQYQVHVWNPLCLSLYIKWLNYGVIRGQKYSPFQTGKN